MITTLQSNMETDFKVEHKDIECFHCHKKGHIACNCPDKPAVGTNMMFVSYYTRSFMLEAMQTLVFTCSAA